MSEAVKTIGEALVDGLKAREVSCVFGIPGVHTVELYRGVAASGLRHVTPRCDPPHHPTGHRPSDRQLDGTPAPPPTRSL